MGSRRWPGNERELRNVFERALITSPDGHLRLNGVLPQSRVGVPELPRAALPARGDILTDERLRQFERANLVAALERSEWRVGGAEGAAELIGISPSTFKSRMKVLAIERPKGEAHG